MRFVLRPSLLAVSAATLLAPVAALRAQTPRDSALAAVNEFFRAMTARDTAATNRVQMPDGMSFAVRWQRDSAVVRHSANASWVQQLGSMKDTYVERIWNPTVLVHGPIAVVWAPYDIHRNGQFVHCGVDAFTLVRDARHWRVATVTYTAEPTGCAPSPLGPPAR